MKKVSKRNAPDDKKLSNKSLSMGNPAALPRCAVLEN